jgi:transcriptional regulator with XRE-family HTH domain
MLSSMNAGELVRETRKRRGLTQEQLAARASTSQAAISRIERGLVSPTVETLARLLDLMHEELVLDAREVDYGHDRTLYERTLSMTPSQRIEHRAEFANFVQRNLGAAAGRTKDKLMATEYRTLADEIRRRREADENARP